MQLFNASSLEKREIAELFGFTGGRGAVLGTKSWSSSSLIAKTSFDSLEALKVDNGEICMLRATFPSCGRLFVEGVFGISPLFFIALVQEDVDVLFSFGCLSGAPFGSEEVFEEARFIGFIEESFGG